MNNFLTFYEKRIDYLSTKLNELYVINDYDKINFSELSNILKLMKEEIKNLNNKIDNLQNENNNLKQLSQKLELTITKNASM